MNEKKSESAFCTTQPMLQRAWDATSYSALMFCARYYQHTIIEGYRQPGNNDLEFGGFFASCVEHYKKGRLLGQTKEQATVDTVRYAIERTFDPIIGPWSGSYEEAWRCTGVEPYRNKKGNRAKCPWSHKGNWFPAPAPQVCGECGSTTELQRRWVSSFTKDRYALLRLVCAYCDNQPQTAQEGPFPICFPDGTPAVELSFRYPLPWNTPDGDPYLACGHMDSLMEYGTENFISDNKTTAKSLNQKYWQAYSPNPQVDLYDVTGSILYPELNIRGVLIEGAQITKTQGIKQGLGIMRRTEAQREEFFRDFRYWLDQAEKFATDNYWPKNTRNCWSCHFNIVCSKDPSMQEHYLKSNFVQSHWNPLEER